MNGFFHYKGIRTLQPATAIECFEEFLRLNKPERIVEIGTASGGLTTILADFTDVPIHTFDIVSNANLSRTGTYPYIMDVFSDIGRATVSKLIQDPGVVLLLCDGGNKVEEFKLFSPLLKAGDFIMAHDYEGRTCHWNWVEFSEKDVSLEGLVPEQHELMAMAAWASYRKT